MTCSCILRPTHGNGGSRTGRTASIGFGTDHLEFLRECMATFSDGLFRIYGIDGADKCPEDTVV